VYSGSINGSGFASAMFLHHVGQLLIEDNIFDHNGWNETLTLPATVTISIGSPAVITWPNNKLPEGAGITFSTTGTLPTGITAGTPYFVVNRTANSFNVATTYQGTPITTSGTQS